MRSNANIERFSQPTRMRGERFDRTRSKSVKQRDIARKQARARKGNR